MRREKPHYVYNWDYNKETSMYDKSDYRSNLYKGKWEKAWLKEIASYAVKRKISLYEAMWLRANDKKEHMPKSLFKFFPFNENSIKCIEKNTVYMNNPRNFNDPFDSFLCANEDEYVKKCLIDYLIETDAISRGVLSENELLKLKESRVEDTEYWNIYETFDSVVLHLCYDANTKKMKDCDSEINHIICIARCEYKNKLEQLRANAVGITSFANINEFKLATYMELWSHYAQNHQGFCVEYDLTQSITNTNENAMVMGGLLPCNYAAKQIIISKNKIYKYIKNIPFTQYEQMEFDKAIMLSFLTKSSSWRYENEWRLILPLDICDIYGKMVPFFPIKAIYTGCRMSDDNREFIYRFAQSAGISVYDMSMHEYKFELERDYSPVDVERYFKDKTEYNMDRLRNSKYNFWKWNYNLK